MVDFDHLGYELNRCGGFLDGIQNCIQTCLHHAVKQLAVIKLFHKGTSINDVSSIFGFLDPPPSPCRLSFSPKNCLKTPFLTPPSLPLKGDVVYGWSLK